MDPGVALLAAWAVVAVLIWAWSIASSFGTEGGTGEVVFLSIMFGVGLSWPFVLVGGVAGLCAYGVLTWFQRRSRRRRQRQRLKEAAG